MVAAHRLVGTAAVAVYSQFFAVLVIVAQLLWVGLVARQPFPGRKVIVCGVALGGLLVPFGVFLLTRNVGQLEWVSALTWGQAGALLALLGGGAASVMYLLCWIAAAGKLIQGRSNSRETPNLLVLLCWLIVPVALTIVYSFHTYVLEPRFLFVCVPGAVLLAAAGLSRYSRKYAGALLGIAVLGSGYSLFEHYIDPAEDWRHAIQYVAQQAVAGDQFVIWPSQADAVFEYYWRKSEHSRQITCTEEPTRAWRELSPDRLWLVALCTGSCTVAQQVFRWAIAKGEYSPVTTLTFPWIRVWLETRKEGSVHASEQGDTGTIAHFPETLLNTVTVCHARQLISQ